MWIDPGLTIKGLECCSNGAKEPYIPTIRYCAECPYNKPGIPCTRALARDSLELIKMLSEQATRSDDEQAVRGGYGILRDAYAALKANLFLLAQTDGEKARAYRGAFGKGLRLMADEIEK